MFSKDPVALAQVIETRRVVEIGNVRLAAARITPAQVAHLDALLAELRTAVDDADRFSTLDIDFHDAVCEAAGNFLLAQFMRIINTLAKVSRERTGALAGHAGTGARRPRGDRRRAARRGPGRRRDGDGGPPRPRRGGAGPRDPRDPRGRGATRATVGTVPTP